MDGHPESSRPLHIFGDILDRLPRDVLERRKATEQGKILAYEQACSAAATEACPTSPGAEGIDAESVELPSMADYKAKLGQDMVDEMIHELERCTFEETVWCHRHKKYCYVDPRSDPRCAGALIVEVAGPCCPPWSSMNPRRDRWLSAATLPALTWVFSTRYRCPSAIVHENAPGWDDTVAVQAFKHVGCARTLHTLYTESQETSERPSGTPVF